MVQKRDSGFSAVPLCLHSGCASGSLVAELLLKFLYNTGAGKSLLEIVYSRFRSFRFFFFEHPAFFSIIPLFFPVIPLFSGHSVFFLFRQASPIIMSALRRFHSVSTPAVRPVRLWGSCYWDSYTTRAQGSCFWKSYTAGFDHSAFFFQSYRFFFPVIPLFFSDHSASFFVAAFLSPR